MSRAVERAGIVKSDAAQRLSLFIPIVWALAFFGEVLTPARGLGVVLAFVALLCLLYKPSIQKFSSNTKGVAASLMGVWLGYGVIDILFKQLAKLDKTAFSGNLLVAFILAGVLMWAYLLVTIIQNHWVIKKLADQPLTMVQPDIMIICDKDKLDGKRCNGAPDFIIEIVSPSTSSDDYIRKLYYYKTYGVREYWIVDPKRKLVTVNYFEGNLVSVQYSFDSVIKVNIYDDLFINFAEIAELSGI